MSSRFFQTGSDSENESSSSEDEVVQQKSALNIQSYQFSDDEEEVKRVVRSTKEKKYEELQNIIKQLKNYKKINDVSRVLTGFENLMGCYQRSRNVFEKEEGGKAPRFFIRCLFELDAFINEIWEDRKNLNKNHAKSLSNLRQKVRKYSKEFESEITDYREQPDVEDEDKEDEESEEESESEEEEKPMATADSFKKKEKIADDASDDDSDWGSSSDEESSLSTDDEKYGGNLAAKFLKKTGDKEVEKEEKKKKEKKKEKEEKKKRREDDEEGGWEEVKGGAPLIVEKPKMFAKDAEINHALVVKKLNEILAARGKKGTDRTEQIELLNELLTIADNHNLGPAIDVKIRFAIVAAIFDYNPNIATCMKPDMWAKLLDHIDQLLNKLSDNQSISVGEQIAEDSEQLVAAPYRVRGCILTIVERMEEEFTKMLQACDAHSNEYVERLKDEKRASEIVDRLQGYLEGKGSSGDICRAYLRKIEHLYYKFDPNVIKQKQVETEDPPPKTSLSIMNELCKYVYAKDTTDRIRTRAMLCHIYHHALHDNWFEARDLMLMSHLQDNIPHSDIPTQILYNRTLVQLGLCAFRHSNIKDSHNCLLDIQSGGRAKELLAQGLLLQRQHERSSEQEKIEKRRQMPFHMHINLELLECVYLVSAMLMEIPYMAAHELDSRRRMISKSFHHQLRNSEKQALVGPPESMREHVVAASKAMRIGNWRACQNYIFNEKMNAKVWDLFYQSEKVREMLTRKIQEESLRTYLFTYSNVYDSISMITLAEMFELERPVVHSIISKMIINEELMASLDEPSQTVMMHRTEPSRLQSLALQLADKVGQLVENNERVLEMKQGSYFRNMGQQGGGYQRQGGYGRQNYQNNQEWGNKPRYNKDRDSQNKKDNYQNKYSWSQHSENYNKN